MPLEQGAHGHDIVGTEALGGAGGQHFGHPLGFIRRADEAATAWSDIQQAFGAKHLDSFPQGCTGDAELFAQHAFGREFIAGFESAVFYKILNIIGYLTAAAVAWGEGIDGEGGGSMESWVHLSVVMTSYITTLGCKLDKHQK